MAEDFDAEVKRRQEELEAARLLAKKDREKWLAVATEYAEWQRALRLLNPNRPDEGGVLIEHPEGN